MLCCFLQDIVEPAIPLVDFDSQFNLDEKGQQQRQSSAVGPQKPLSAFKKRTKHSYLPLLRQRNNGSLAVLPFSRGRIHDWFMKM